MMAYSFIDAPFGQRPAFFEREERIQSSAVGDEVEANRIERPGPPPSSMNRQGSQGAVLALHQPSHYHEQG
jgi:hypothetical protein